MSGEYEVVPFARSLFTLSIWQSDFESERAREEGLSVRHRRAAWRRIHSGRPFLPHLIVPLPYLHPPRSTTTCNSVSCNAKRAKQADARKKKIKTMSLSRSFVI